MDMRKFSAENYARCVAPNGFNHQLGAWSLSDWMTALAGEIGEAANVIKKLNRIRDGFTNRKGETETELREKLGDELADGFIYLDLLAQAANLDLPAAVRRKFDEVSAEIGYAAPPPKRPEGIEYALISYLTSDETKISIVAKVSGPVPYPEVVSPKVPLSLIPPGLANDWRFMTAEEVKEYKKREDED